MKITGGPERFGGRYSVVFGVAALFVAACTPDFATLTPFSPDASDPRYNHPITVERTVNMISLSGAVGDERLSPGEAAQLDRFFRSYLTNGRGQLVVTVSGDDSAPGETLAKGKRVVERARAAGLRPGEIVLTVETVATDGGGQLTLSYDAYVVRVPECGDWSKGSSYDFRNTEYSNYGCSVQRNVGLMIANPADLVASREAGRRDTARSNAVIQLDRAGKSTSAERTDAESAEIADVGQ